MTLDYILSNPSQSFSSIDLAKALRVDPVSIRRRLESGVLKGEYVAGRWIIRGEWISNYLSKQNE